MVKVKIKKKLFIISTGTIFIILISKFHSFACKLVNKLSTKFKKTMNNYNIHIILWKRI
jgi:hypothetical protein